MTDLNLVMQKLDGVLTVLNEHGELLKDSRADITKREIRNEVQQEQINTIILRTDAMWVSVDSVKNHQQKCPRPQLQWIKLSIGLMYALLAGLIFKVKS